MAEVTRADLQAHFPIAEVTNGQIDFALAKAIAEVKARVGATAYADAIATTPTDATASAFINEAVELFTMARLLRNINLRFRRNGLVVQEQDAGSPDFGGKQITNEYLKPSEQAVLADSYRKQAFEVLEIIGISNGQPLYKFVSVSDTVTASSVRRKTSSEFTTTDD